MLLAFRVGSVVDFDSNVDVAYLKGEVSTSGVIFDGAGHFSGHILQSPEAKPWNTCR